MMVLAFAQLAAAALLWTLWAFGYADPEPVQVHHRPTMQQVQTAMTEGMRQIDADAARCERWQLMPELTN